MDKYFPPEYEKKSFHCPYCNVFANQTWRLLGHQNAGFSKYPGLEFSNCTHCNKNALWLHKIMISPEKTTAPNHHEDLPDELVNDYLEAASIVSKSPRGASALLRLVLQKLMVCLGEQGKDINKDIGSLVQKGLHPNVQQALDIVRVIGNESVHPGKLDLKDDTGIANQLFNLINFIVEDRITRPKTIESLFNQLPEGKRKGIEERDKVRTPE